MDINNQVEKIFSYLLAVKNLNDKTIRNIENYDKVFWRKKLEDLGCNINHKNDELVEEWISISKNNKKVYDDISKIYLKLQKNSENLELIYANGIITGEIEENKICHPILTTKLELKYNEKEDKFLLKPYNNKTNVELEFLSGLEDVNFDLILNLKNDIRKLGIDLTNEEEVLRALNLVCERLELDAENLNLEKLCCNEDLVIKDSLNLFNAPSIILRKVDTRLWNMELNSMLEGIREGNEIPKTIEVLVDANVPRDDEDGSFKYVGEDLLFPLPSNETQEEIVKRLSENFGVVVQGPPGTGKSHTIVNLICHLLAHGKRVLVTSQTDRALRVLSDKIPEEIRALCISILGDDSKSLEELDESVRKIVEHISVDTTELREEIKESRYALDKCKEVQRELYEKLRHVETTENQYVEYKGSKYTIKDIATWVRENKQCCNWIEDSLDEYSEVPLKEEEIIELLELLTKLKEKELEDFNLCKDNLKELLSKKNIDEKIRELNKLEIYEEDYLKNVSILNSIYDLNIRDKNIYKLINTSIDILKDIEKTWLKKLMANVYSSKENKENWKNFNEKCKEYIREINNLKLELSSHQVNLPAYEDLNKLKADFEIISKHINSKGKINGVFKLLHGNCKYILEECTIDYKALSTKEDVILVEKLIDSLEKERALVVYFNNNLKDFGAERLRYSDESFKIKIEEYIGKIDSVLSFEEKYKDVIKSQLKDSYFNKELDFYKSETYESIMKALESAEKLRSYRRLKDDIKSFKASLPKNKLFKNLESALEEQDIEKTKKFFNYIDDLKDIKEEVIRLEELEVKLRETCPLTYKKFKEASMTKERAEKFKNLNDAFKWKKLNNFIEELDGVSLKDIENSLQEEKYIEAQLVKELVAKKSWYNQILRTTEEQKRSLFTWMEAIKRIGKGTGSQAVKYRKLAQKEMDNCKDVIPVWIMPINRVIENIKPYGELFDVVIVDESSQSDISALTVLMRGKRAVIVGDEKQISPEAIGKDTAVVEKLIEEYLTEIPHSEWFDLKTSLYNTALRVFPNRLILKEHFRSVPEIINFSNEFTYCNEIIPLRCGRGEENFEEPVKAVKVENALREEKTPINKEEAKTIVDTIVNCCRDPRYNNMTMGVISLLGDAQAEYIEELLIERLGMEEIIRRKLICGDAYSFQGDERDVMFLSMVIAKNAKFAALTKESDERRFNVAASRARNQMWIFHSVDLEDINPKCVRYELLNYAQNYNHKNYEGNNHSALMNSFKKDVYKYLLDEKYDVTPNVKIGKYHLDFIINNPNNASEKVALKCVGGNEEDYKWEEDYKRQITLERVGWKFFKVRSSEFYSKGVIEKLPRY